MRMHGTKTKLNTKVLVGSSQTIPINFYLTLKWNTAASNGTKPYKKIKWHKAVTNGTKPLQMARSHIKLQMARSRSKYQMARNHIKITMAQSPVKTQIGTKPCQNINWHKDVSSSYCSSPARAKTKLHKAPMLQLTQSLRLQEPKLHKASMLQWLKVFARTS